MLSKSELKKLMACFPGSFINDNFEFIAYAKTNLYFILDTCETELDAKCKVLEWFSRDACKTQAYRNKQRNDLYHNEIRDCINNYLGTDFTEEQMLKIYTKLGNCCNHYLTRDFICNDYNFNLLED